MSADSPKRGGVHKGTQVVSPQPIVDRSIIDSVAGIINDIVPQAYATPNSDNKESISWARFEYADINDPSVYPDYNEGSNIPPLLLVLGYSTGVQVWLISATGEATEVLSWRQGVVRTLRILPNPKTDDKCIDLFEPKRPMVAICDSAGPGPQFCNVSFISLKTGEQTKNIKFKNPVCDILANRRSIVVTFLEKIAVFDARSLEDVLTVTTCYASPGPNPNPVALGTRWLAYSEKILLPTRRSSGGCEGEGVQSYTATVLYAAKSLGKGLRGLGETVASSLTGNSVSTMTINNMGNDVTHPGVITILDLQVAKEEKDTDDDANVETVIAHFTAHTEAIVAMTFDLTGALLMTADKRGHDFHVFRIQPHPDGPTLAAVHHLYILHRGDTTAKVQDMTFSSDTRWAAVSTVRGTTHVFPVAPYGGPVGVRTHSTPHVVNRLSRFHRSAGLTDDSTRSHSPVSHTELPYPVYPYTNPRLPPYPHPTILHPLAQIRQPSSLNHANSQTQPRHPQRQRLHSDDSGTLPLKICACFAPPRAWIYAQREASSKIVKRAVDSLFIMACHGNMIQYDLEPKPAAGIPKEKVCDDTIIELEVEAKGQWPLLRSPNSLEIVPPLSMTSPFLSISTVLKNAQPLDSTEDRWLSQVEIVTHAGPHRRLWMGPQFVFKTYNAPSGVAVNLVEAEAVEIGVTGGSRPARSNPVNMPHAASRPLMPIVIDGSGSSYEQSPRFMEAYGDALDSENVGIGSGENQLREDLAEAMLETSIAPHRAPGRRSVFERVGQPVTKVVNPLGTVITVSADEEDVSSSQEFDSAEEGLVPEPPRSVCAEEGPASLGDLNLEPESQTLRDLTEICAEMRSASEPAIDSVPDESIREVKERKTLCAEMAALITTRHCSIDFEKEEAFRDVPSSLSLCAEQGEIPSSPMTQAKENAWCKKAIKYDETKAHEKNYAKAKYVVSYDEDSVVLVENKISCDRGGVRVQSKDERCISRSAQDSSRQAYVVRKSPEFKKPSKSSGKYAPSNDSVVSKENQIYIDKYSIKEHEDSIIIEDTSQYRDTKSNYMKRKVSNIKEERSVDSGETSTNKEFQRLPKESFDAPKYKQKAKMSRTHARSKNSETKSEEAEGCNEAVESFVELKVQEALVDDDVCKEGKAPVEDARAVVTVIKDCILSNLEPLPLDDFSSIEYHMVETNFHNKETTSSNQSDENIEHIQSSEITRICQFDHDDNPDKSTEAPTYSESSPTAQRKSSKSTISDDDLEYIHSSELAEALDKCNNSEKSFGTEDYNDRLLTMRTQSKHKLSSDDDLEHTQCSDICVIEPEISATEIDSSEKSYASIMKSQEASIEQVCKVKRSRKPKDIVVIESDTSEPEVTVIVHPQESRARCKTPEKDTSEEIDKYTASKDIPVDYKVHQNILEKVKVRNPKIASSALLPKRSNLNAIEIIDIDAMQKAELETATESTSTPECKILTPRHEITGTRSRKSRKNRKVHSEAVVQDTVVAEPVASFQSSKIYMTELQEAAEELLINSKWQEQKISTPALEVSWSAIVKKKSNPPSETVPRKESNLEPVIEVGKKSKCEDTKKLDPTIKESEFHGLDHFFDTLEMKSNLEATKMAACSKKVCESAVTSDPIIIDFLASLINSTDDKIQSHDSSSVVSAVESKTDKILGGGSLDGNKISQIDRSTSRAASVSSKENSPEIERDPEPEKKSDSEQEIMPERSSSSDELNANIMHMDVEDDCPVREIVEKGTISGTTSFLSSGVKKGNRSKKKKRR